MRRLYHGVLVLALLSTGRVGTALADTPSPPPKTYDLAAIDSYVASQVREKSYLGLSLAILRDGKIVFAKAYSNTGFTILGRVVEKVSGEPLGTFLERRILEPLQMRHSYFAPRSDVAGLARGHTAFALGPPEPALVEAQGWIDAAGGMYASAS